MHDAPLTWELAMCFGFRRMKRGAGPTYLLRLPLGGRARRASAGRAWRQPDLHRALVGWR